MVTKNSATNGIAQGEQAGERLVGVVRLADEQPGQEGPQGEGESDGLGHRRRPSPMARATSRNSSWLCVRATRVISGETTLEAR